MKFNFWYVPALLWTAFVVYACLLPGSDVPKLWFLQFPQSDKVIHIVLWAGMIFLFCFGTFYKKEMTAFRNYNYFNWILFGIVMGITLETLQKILPLGRDFEWLDWAADSAGSILGAYVYYTFTRWFSFLHK